MSWFIKLALHIFPETLSWWLSSLHGRGVQQSAVMTSSPSNHPLSAALGALGDAVSLNSIHILFF